MNCGISSASANALRVLLNQSNDPTDESNRDGYTGNAVGLIAGGAREANCFAPNAYRCVIAKRRGFVRIALEAGASLVPVISFGENNVYKAIDCQNFSPPIKRLIAKYINKNHLILNGRGFFQYSFGIVPVRSPVVTVVGGAINLKKTPNPSIEEIERVHKDFCTKLTELFETHKIKYVENYENVHLEII